MFFKSKLLKYLVLILLVGVTLFIFFRSASRKEGFDAVQALKTRTDAIAELTTVVADATNEYNEKKQFRCPNRGDCPNTFDYVNDLKQRMESYSGELHLFSFKTPKNDQRSFRVDATSSHFTHFIEQKNKKKA